MTKGRKHIGDLPHIDPKQEIDIHLKNISIEIQNSEFISAHNRLKRLLELIFMISNRKEKEHFKKKYQNLNNELNIKIIEYLEENRKKEEI